MRYLSPASLPDSPLINLSDKKSLQLQKKKLLAELELNATGEIKINDRTLSKNDILQYFETLEDETILRYHETVSKDKPLTAFLENSRLPDDASFAQSSLYGDPGFLQWISPYFYTAFTEYVKYCLQNNDESGLRNLLQNPLLLIDYDRERAWIEIGQVLENNIARLDGYQEQANRKKRKPDIAGVSALTSDTLTRMILLLPKDQFARVRDNYSFTVMQLSILLFNRGRFKRDLAASWLYTAKTLAVSESRYNQVVAKGFEMDGIRKKGERNLGVRAIIVISIVVLRMITSNAGCNSSGTTSTRVYTKLTKTPCATCPLPGSSTASFPRVSTQKP